MKLSQENIRRCYVKKLKHCKWVCSWYSLLDFKISFARVFSSKAQSLERISDNKAKYLKKILRKIINIHTHSKSFIKYDRSHLLIFIFAYELLVLTAKLLKKKSTIINFNFRESSSSSSLSTLRCYRWILQIIPCFLIF